MGAVWLQPAVCWLSVGRRVGRWVGQGANLAAWFRRGVQMLKAGGAL
jgi:hypothetical protein